MDIQLPQHCDTSTLVSPNKDYWGICRPDQWGANRTGECGASAPVILVDCAPGYRDAQAEIPGSSSTHMKLSCSPIWSGNSVTVLLLRVPRLYQLTELVLPCNLGRKAGHHLCLLLLTIAFISDHPEGQLWNPSSCKVQTTAPVQVGAPSQQPCPTVELSL